MNKFVSVSVGDVIHLVVPGVSGTSSSAAPASAAAGDAASNDGEDGPEEGKAAGEREDNQQRHALEVSALRGLPGVRCGLPEGAAQPLDVSAALLGVTGGDPSKGVPVRAACLVDADVECDFAPSFETVGREEGEAKAKAEAAEAEQAAARAAAQLAADAKAERAARREAAKSALASLPVTEASAAVVGQTARGDGTTTCAVRCPDGTRLLRTFSKSDSVLSCFRLVEAEWNEPEGVALLPADFCLVTRHPRRCLRRAECEAAGTTFEAAGLVSTQEALFVETTSPAE